MAKFRSTSPHYQHGADYSCSSFNHPSPHEAKKVQRNTWKSGKRLHSTGRISKGFGRAASGLLIRRQFYGAAQGAATLGSNVLLAQRQHQLPAVAAHDVSSTPYHYIQRHKLSLATVHVPRRRIDFPRSTFQQDSLVRSSAKRCDAKVQRYHCSTYSWPPYMPRDDVSTSRGRRFNKTASVDCNLDVLVFLSSNLPGFRPRGERTHTSIKLSISLHRAGMEGRRSSAGRCDATFNYISLSTYPIPPYMLRRNVSISRERCYDGAALATPSRPSGLRRCPEAAYRLPAIALATTRPMLLLQALVVHAPRRCIDFRPLTPHVCPKATYRLPVTAAAMTWYLLLLHTPFMVQGKVSTSRHRSCNDAALATPSGPRRTCPKATYRFPVTAVPTTRHLLLHKASLAPVHAPTQCIDFPSPLLLLLRAPLMPRGNVSSSGHRCRNDAALATSPGPVHAPTQCRLPVTLYINYITVYTYFLPTSCPYMPQGNITTSRDRCRNDVYYFKPLRHPYMPQADVSTSRDRCRNDAGTCSQYAVALPTSSALHLSQVDVWSL
ncbi:hypothetical protein B0H34DRAFT_828239 [Crassisporium funariophilum]|nr:hypothetical protein B0H34DRAFT_828239 [Crassisporium funariophilum]